MAVGRVSARKLAGLAVFLGALALLCAPAVLTESVAPVSLKDYAKLDLELARIGEEFDQYRLTRGERNHYIAMRDKRHKMRKRLRVGGITGVVGILGSILSSNALHSLRKKKPDPTTAKVRYGALSLTFLLSVALFLNGLAHSVKAAGSAAKANMHRHQLLVELLRRYKGGRQVNEADFVTDPYTTTEGEDGHVPD